MVGDYGEDDGSLNVGRQERSVGPFLGEEKNAEKKEIFEGGNKGCELS